MDVGSAVLRWHGLQQDEGDRERERAESRKLLALARSTNLRARRVADRVERMSTLYRERLEGVRTRD